MHSQINNSKKIILSILTIILIVLNMVPVQAANTDDSILEPSQDQYLELRAVSIKDIAGQNKQVIMELWGNNIDFKRI